MYGGSAYAYSVDPDFASVGYSEAQWQEVIDEFYRKYKGLHKWHISIVQEVTKTGKLVMPTGRIYEFSQVRRGNYLEWPRTQILNYPVQGLGADLLSLARTRAKSLFRLHKVNGILVSTVHDSLLSDSSRESVNQTAIILVQSVKEIPELFERLWKKPFNLPLTSEIEIGMNLADMEKYVLT